MPQINIESREQYINAIRVLDKVGGGFQGVGPASDPVLLVSSVQYDALAEAGVVSSNGSKGGNKHGTKRPRKKAKS